MNGTELKEQNKERLFLEIYNHKWLTVRQLGVVGWSNQSDEAQRVSASRFIRQNIEDGFLLDRLIRDVGGTIATLSRKGEKWMNDRGYSVMGGYKWGNFNKDGVWEPPANFRHDFMANEFLIVELNRRMNEINEEKINSLSYFVNLSENLVNYQHRNEREFRKASGTIQIPDGVFWDQGLVNNYGEGYLPAYFLEVESYRKTGKKMNRMIYACLKRAAEWENSIKVWQHPNEVVKKKSEVMNFGISNTVFVYDVNECDERGYKLNHKQRLISAFHRKFKSGWGEILHNRTSISVIFAPFDSLSRKFLEWEDFELELAS